MSHLLNAGHIGGASARLDGFMSDLTLDHLRATAVMGFILSDPALCVQHERAFAVMLPVFDALAIECTERRQSGEQSLNIAAQHVPAFACLTSGARQMRPSFPRQNIPTDKDLELLALLQQPEGLALEMLVVELERWSMQILA